MILDRPESHFIFIYHREYVYGNYKYISYKGKPLTNKEYLEHWGKWIILGSREEMDELTGKLDAYVEKKLIPCVKYDRAPLSSIHLRECVMLVYCDDRQKEDVWQILSDLGVEIKAWAYDRETMKMWLPGGRLLEKWIRSHNLNVEQADQIRKNAVLKFSSMFEDDDAIFTGVIQ